MNGRDSHGTYAVDWSRRPFHLDIAWEKQTFMNLVEFTADGKLRLQTGTYEDAHKHSTRKRSC